MTLSELIERVEKLEEPSELIDGEIYWHLSEWENLGGWWRRHKVTGKEERFSYVSPPPVTASLDAAIALTDRVLPDANRTIRKRFRTTEGRVDGHRFDAQVTGGDVCDGFNEATALVLATLRALSARERDDG